MCLNFQIDKINTMKYKSEFKKIIGFTQEEMAVYLGITESQWSMFKSGKRDLPLLATKQLSLLLSHLQEENEFKVEVQSVMEKEQNLVTKKLLQELQYVIFKHLQAERKIATIEKIREECFAGLKTIVFMESQSLTPLLESLIPTIKSRINKTLQKHSLYHLEQLLITKLTLEEKRKFIEQKLRR